MVDVYCKKLSVVCTNTTCFLLEHRSTMETAYVYGAKYQFILITGGPVLKQLGYVLSSPVYEKR